MDRTVQYEQLVALCEQYDPELPNSHETLFAIAALEDEIGTVEAELIVAAFMDRTRLRRAQFALVGSFKQVLEEQTKIAEAERDRRLARKVLKATRYMSEQTDAGL